MTAPRVSVVLPTHNRARFVGRAVASALAQTERDLELIVVDDASTDDTLDRLTALAAADARVRVISNATAQGGGGARNVGIGASRGEWIAFLDDDDEWVPTKLAVQLATLATNPAAVACSCSYSHHGTFGRTRVVHPPHDVTVGQLLRGNVLGGASVCVCSRAVLRTICGFDVGFRSGQDWDLWLRLRLTGTIAVAGTPLVNYQDYGPVRISSNMLAQYLGERRFYFKHRHLMDDSVRRHRLAYISYIKSRQPTRSTGARARYLAIALRHAEWRFAFAYAVSSLPRLIVDACRQVVVGRRHAIP